MPVDEPHLYKLTLQRYDGVRVLFEFQSTPARRRERVGRRVCTKISIDGNREVKQREAGVVFPIKLPANDTGKVPWFFRRGRKLVAEVAWDLTSEAGQLRQPDG